MLGIVSFAFIAVFLFPFLIINQVEGTYISEYSPSCCNKEIKRRKKA